MDSETAPLHFSTWSQFLRRYASTHLAPRIAQSSLWRGFCNAQAYVSGVFDRLWD